MAKALTPDAFPPLPASAHVNAPATVIDGTADEVYDAEAYALPSGPQDGGGVLAHESAHVLQGHAFQGHVTAEETLEAASDEVVEAVGRDGLTPEEARGRQGASPANQAYGQASAQASAQAAAQTTATTTADPEHSDAHSLAPHRDDPATPPEPAPVAEDTHEAPNNPYLTHDDAAADSAADPAPDAADAGSDATE